MLSLYACYAVAVGNIIFIVYFVVLVRHSLCSEKRRITKTEFELSGVQKAEQNVPKVTARSSVQWLFCLV